MIPPSETAPFYMDWQFWSALVALAALVLTQLPPLHILFRRPRITCETFNRMAVTHKAGNPNVQWHLIIENKGRGEIKVKAISLRFTRLSDAVTFEMPAQAYFRQPDDPNAPMFTPFRLKPGEEWSHGVSFFATFNRNDEREFRSILTDMRSEISALRALPENRDVVVHVTDDLRDRALAFYHRYFVWEPSEYTAVLSVLTDNDKANVSANYRFTLFEAESEALKEQAGMYGTGGYLVWYPTDQTTQYIPLYEE